MTDAGVPYDEIDPNMRSLVHLLNSLPGISTFSCCGGHPEPRRRGQKPQGTFDVTLHVSPIQESWESLRFLAEFHTGTGHVPNPDEKTVSEPRGEEIILRLSWSPVEGCVQLDLIGHHGADPERLAERLSTDMKEWFAELGSPRS